MTDSGIYLYDELKERCGEIEGMTFSDQYGMLFLLDQNGNIVLRLDPLLKMEDKKMTDDKGAGEGPYGIDETIEIKPFVFVRIDSYAKLEIANAAFASSRKAERERCARIAEDLIPTHSHCEDGYKYECYTGHIIADKIRGGQDAK